MPLKDGVRVTSLHPGIVETAIWDGMIGASDESRYTTGSALVIDGGRSIS